MEFITSFLEAGANIATKFGSILVSAVNAVSSILWTPGVENAPGQLTIVGASLALAAGVGVVYLIFRMVRGLVKQNNRG